jgi:septum formation protein
MTLYSMKQELILASGSPRRSEMLTSSGIRFTKHVADIEELVLPGESPQAMVERLSVEKGRAVAQSFPDTWVLSADTTVTIDGEILNKPINIDDSFLMLKKIAGRTHTVWGGMTLMHLNRQVVMTESFSSMVTLKALSEEEIVQYIKTGEPADKAGSYAIQGIGASLVTAVSGSYTNVVGMNLAACIDMLRAMDIVTIANE